jgi:hypothetical protein
VPKVLYAVFDRKKGILKRSSKKGKVLNFFAAQPLGTRKHLLIAEREISPGRDYWRRIHV